eukprot:TRINITY_DN502_c0_g1_i1.p1 TRINITY_DN502_c0_g1~~TRINITY_DN502_c0_g1_i1.p1  ORF type:complete len:669 (-),score=243.04 TRINITY_DN502_c0_g1_i1:82-2088(-)
MADKGSIQGLQRDFPDMSQSTIGDILREYKGDKAAAAAALGGINQTTKQENDKKIEELRSAFPDASVQDCREVLQSVDWNVDAAIEPLFNLMKDPRHQKQSGKQVDRESKRKMEALKEYEHLLEIFNTIPKEQIQRLLDENEGDVEETTVQLLGLVTQQEEEKNKAKQQTVRAEEQRMQQEQEMRLRELKIQALEEKFEDLTERDVISALEATGWDIQRAHTNLFLESTQKKRAYLKHQFQSATDAQIEQALALNNWDRNKAVHLLTEQMREKRNSPIIIKRTAPDFLAASTLMAQKIEEEVAASHLQAEKALKEEGRAVFKEKLEHIMKTQARTGVSPGMAPPPLVKQIDQLLGKASPIDENELLKPVQPVEQPQIKPSDSTMEEKPQEGQFVVKLNTPEVADIGNTIVVDWEMTIGQSTPNDWIGFYAVDQPNKSYITYQWRGNVEGNKGSVSFVAPNYYGTFEFRYFVNKSYQHTAISNRIVVKPRVELQATVDESKNTILVDWNQLTGNKYPRAWIGFYSKSQENNKQFLTWEYAAQPQVSFTKPVKPGQYEFRFFTNSFEDVARSNTITVEGEDSLKATYENGVLTVDAHIVSADPASDGVWLGVFFTSEKDNRQWRRYKFVTIRDGNIEFKSPPKTHGEYEVRLFANKTYDLLAKSNSFNIM